jgi:hypothetical protein
MITILGWNSAMGAAAVKLKMMGMLSNRVSVGRYTRICVSTIILKSKLQISHSLTARHFWMSCFFPRYPPIYTDPVTIFVTDFSADSPPDWHPLQ